MTSTLPAGLRSEQLDEVRRESGLDVDWLLNSQKEHNATLNNANRARSESQPKTPATKVEDNSSAKPSERAQSTPSIQVQEPTSETEKPQTPQKNPSSAGGAAPPVTNGTNAPQTPPPQQASRPSLGVRGAGADEGKQQGKSPVSSLKKEGRRGSWLSNLGSKFSSSSSHNQRNASTDLSAGGRKSPLSSPAAEKGNPLDKKGGVNDKTGTADKPPVITPPRRPSVLVAAGTETKLEHSPGFLSNALRRLSSSNTASMGKGAGSGALCPRKIMNIDHNRERSRISEFDQNKLRRVAFKVDVEIAGIAAQAEEQYEPPMGTLPKSNAGQAMEKKDPKLAKHKDMGEGAALKNPDVASAEKDSYGKPRADAEAEAKAYAEASAKNAETKEDAPKIEKDDKSNEEDEKKDDPAAENKSEQPTTRKKEKKKRSEAERKERKERKRKHAEANGLIPLEITLEDDDSDSSPSNTPPGASTPRKDQPTTDPLRIYKRCCQLRETTALSIVKEQIQKPAATLAEAPGIVAIIDLSGNEMSLPDITTLGDWLAVVPVRKLILDNCNLSDEAVRIILSGLSSCKSQDQARANRKIVKKGNAKPVKEQMGIVEKLSLKNNTAISIIGWKHIALFMHMCRSLRGLDLSGIPFPSSTSGDLSRTSTSTAATGTTFNTPTYETPTRPRGLAHLVARALSERYGDKLEELIMSGCSLDAHAVADIVDSAIKCKIKRLGLANNSIDEEALGHVVRYVTSGVCEGLDMGGNDLNGCGHLLTEVLNESNPLFALSLADTNLGVGDLNACMNHFSKLQNFKFIDLSRNKALFNSDKDAVSILRKHLPKMRELKRIHLADVDMIPDQLIALAEVFPDCPTLAHISVLDNKPLVDTMNSPKGEAQEEACAFFVSLMTAVRASKTIVAIEIEVPGVNSSEVVKALSSQVVAYSLRNFERATLVEVGVANDSMPKELDNKAPEVLMHLVGHMDGYSENHDNDDPAPDEDYMIASTGIVKALNVCLTNKDSSRSQSRNISPTASGTATPRHGAGGLKPLSHKKPKDVSLELCESARKIRQRLRPALLKEDRAGNVENYRRLFYLDQTLERMIQRFEDEYPETKKPETLAPIVSRQSSTTSGRLGQSIDASSDGILSRMTSAEEAVAEGSDPYSLKLSRTSSNTSLAARVLTQEEGRMHRFGQSMRRELLKPTGTDDALHGTSVNDAPEADHLDLLRSKLEQYQGDEIRQKVNENGADSVIKEIGVNAEELKALKLEDPEGFEAFRDSQLAAQVNSGFLEEKNLQKEHGGTRGGVEVKNDSKPTNDHQEVSPSSTPASK